MPASPPSPSSRPSAVVFDLGKVLLDFDYGIAVRRLAARSRLDAPALGRLIDQSPLLYRFERGELTTGAFFQEVVAATGFMGDLAEFGAMFGDIFTPIPPMLDLHAELRAARVPVFLFSNTNALAVDYIRRQFPFFADFDGHVLSYEHGAMKPDPALYEVVERQTGLSGGRLLYLDDRGENIATAADRGWRAVRHEDPAATRREVERSGLLNSALSDPRRCG